MTVVGIIQARMGSTRLPGKVLQPILDKPVLWWGVYRLKKARLIDQIVIATTELPQDDVLVELGEAEHWRDARGSENDVLDRYYQAARDFAADVVVRITSDCPLIDPGVTDYTIAAYLSAAPTVDYVNNLNPRTYPRGLDTEVFSFAALERAHREDRSSWREHVTPYIHQQPALFRLGAVANLVDYARYRWTVDTPEDLELVRTIYQHFGHGDFSWQDALKAVEEHPAWADINRDIQQKAI